MKLKKNPALSNKDYAKKCLTNIQSIKNALARLKEKGYISISIPKVGLGRESIVILKEWPKPQQETNDLASITI